MAESRSPRFYGAGGEFYEGKNILFVHDEPEHDEIRPWGQPLTTPLTIEQLADAVIAKQDLARTPREQWTDEQIQLRDRLIAVFTVLQEVRLAGFEMPGEHRDNITGGAEVHNG